MRLQKAFLLPVERLAAHGLSGGGAQAMPVETPGRARPRKSTEPVTYDADQKLLAFGGTLSLLIGSLFWALYGTRMVVEGAFALGAAALALAGAGLFTALMAWGLRAKMERGAPITRFEVDRLIAAGFVFGVLFGFLIFLALRLKLQDPGLFYAVGQPENTPPLLR